MGNWFEQGFDGRMRALDVVEDWRAAEAFNGREVTVIGAYQPAGGPWPNPNTVDESPPVVGQLGVRVDEGHLIVVPVNIRISDRWERLQAAIPAKTCPGFIAPNYDYSKLQTRPAESR